MKHNMKLSIYHGRCTFDIYLCVLELDYRCKELARGQEIKHNDDGDERERESKSGGL